MSSEIFREIKDMLSKKGFKSSTRLAIMLYLLAKKKSLFLDLVEALDITPGNLWSHLEKLEREGLIKISYVISGRPRALITITDKGYRETMNVLHTLIMLLENVVEKTNQDVEDLSGS